MKSFLALVAKHGTLDRKLLADVAKWGAEALQFRHMPYRATQWRSPSGRTAVFAWDNDTHDTDSRTLIYSGEGYAVTSVGYVSHPAIVNGFDLGSITSAVSVDSYTVPLLGGGFALLRAEESDDTISVWNTVTRQVPVYWGITQEVVLVGTRALLVSFVLARRPQPDYELRNLIPFLSDGFFASEQTPFRGVHVMPANARLTASASGVTVAPIDGFDDECGTIVPTRQDFDAIADSLLRAVSSFRDSPVECSLTGGKDSRLVVAALRAAGVDFRTGTHGFAKHPDVVIAKRIADLLRVEHRHTVPVTEERAGASVLTVDVLGRAHRCLFGSDGMLFAFENVKSAHRFSSALVGMGGGAGESLRGGFAKQVAARGEVTWERALQFVKNRFLGQPELFEKAAAADYSDFLDEWMERQMQSTRPAVALDKFYLYYRTGRWLAASRSCNYGGYGLPPLADNLVTKAALRIREEVKLSEELVYEMLKRLAPELVDVPFADNRWSFEKNGPRPGEEDEWRRRTPLKIERGSRDAFNWRSTVTTDLYGAFYDQIFNDSRASAIFDLIDRERLRRIMEDDRGKPPPSRRMVLYWSIYSASVLLSNEWLKQNGDERIVEITVPTA